jgi:hypothetical protein
MPNYSFKVANMKKEQEFILYPYTGGDYILLQSDKRFMRVNIRTGIAIINAKNRNYANSIHLQMEPLACELPEEIKLKIQGFLWHNEGKNGNIGNVLSWENKELFSELN